MNRGFPRSPVVKNPPANAGDISLISDQGRSHMPKGNYVHAPQLRNLRAASTEAHVPTAYDLQQQKPLQWVAYT